MLLKFTGGSRRVDVSEMCSDGRAQPKELSPESSAQIVLFQHSLTRLQVKGITAGAAANRCLTDWFDLIPPKCLHADRDPRTRGKMSVPE